MGLLSAIQDEQFWRDVAKNGRGLLQGASNAVASNITGPVDLINAGMGLLGMPISREPVGGEAWARKKGLTAAAPGAAGLAGETLGLVVPMVAAGKAPQIAAGMLKMADNAAVPSAANQAARNQLGAIVYHGSPHKFDRFDASKIGTGEGAQAYGHGLYFAESPKVAEGYRKKLSGVDGYDPAKHIEGIADAWNLNLAKQAIQKFNGDYEGAISRLQSLKPNVALPQSVIDRNIEALAKKQVFLDPKGALYKVDLPDNAIARMLDWDKPLSQQAPEVTAKAKAALDAKYGSGTFDAFASNGGDLKDLVQNFDDLGRGGMEAMFRSKGIPGIRYLDGGSRGAGAGTSNFVVFPGEESLLKILERNGVAP